MQATTGHYSTVFVLLKLPFSPRFSHSLYQCLTNGFPLRCVYSGDEPPEVRGSWPATRISGSGYIGNQVRDAFRSPSGTHVGFGGVMAATDWDRLYEQLVQ